MKGLAALFAVLSAHAQIAVQGDMVYTASGAPIRNGVVLMRDGKIERVGPALAIPPGYTALRAKVVTPGLIDAHTVVGMSGLLNQAHDQDQLDRSNAVQPDLRAIDAYNARDPLVEWVRGFGVTTIHTGHGPGALLSGQTMIAKTGAVTADKASMVETAMLAATLGDSARGEGGKAPGTRAKMIALLRTELVKAQEGVNRPKDQPRSLQGELFTRLIRRELPILITAQRSHDIVTAIRLAKEFHLRLVIDGAAEAQLAINEIKASGFPVILHPTMARASGESENLSMETAAKLQAAGIPFALQSGFESYVPKTRVVLFEAGVAAANGLTFDQALASVTISAARILGVDTRVGSIEVGKDADLAMFDGDPFEYTTHCTGVIVDGKIVSESAH